MAHDEILKVAGEPGAVAGERDALHMHAMLGAAKPPEIRVDLQSPDPEIQVPPPRLVLLTVLAMPRRIAALRADKPPTTQRDLHHDPVGLKLHRSNPYSGQAQQTRECGRDAHGQDLRLEELDTREPTVQLVRVSQAPTNPRDERRSSCSRPYSRLVSQAELTDDHPRSLAKVRPCRASCVS
jgi:hypothetical protein